MKREDAACWVVTTGQRPALPGINLVCHREWLCLPQLISQGGPLTAQGPKLCYRRHVSKIFFSCFNSFDSALTIMPSTLRSRMGGDLGKEVARSRGSPVHTTGLMADTALMPHLPDRTERIPWKPPYFLYMVNFPLGYPWADHLWRLKGTQGPRSMGMTLTVRYRDKQTQQRESARQPCLQGANQ